MEEEARERERERDRERQRQSTSCSLGSGSTLMLTGNANLKYDMRWEKSCINLYKLPTKHHCVVGNSAN